MMKLLIDENVATKIKEGLVKLGFEDTKHINEVAKGISDKEVFDLAKKEERIIITGDDDFKASNFKYENPIIWITPNARYDDKICEKISWILKNSHRYNINQKRFFIAITMDKYNIEFKNKDGIFGKIKKTEISNKKIK